MTNYKDKLSLSNCTFFYFVFSLVCVYGQGLLGRRRRAIQEIPVKAGKLDIVALLLQKGLLLLLILTTEKQRALEREKMEKGHSPS